MPPPTAKGGRSIVWVPLILLALAAGFVLGGACVYYYQPLVKGKSDQNFESTDSRNSVVALGRIEPHDGILSLGVAAPDRIREIKVEEDALVTQGQSLVILESKKMRELEQTMAIIQLEQARKRLKAIKANGEAQIHVAELRRDRTEQLEPLERKMLENKIKLLKQQEDNAQRNHDRYVAAGDTIADMDKEKQELATQQIKTDIGATKDQIAKLHTSTKLDLSLAKAQLQAAEAELMQTQSTISLAVLGKQVDQAEERVNESTLLAPSDGTILRIFAHKGDLVQSKPILQMANVDHMIVLAEVDEKEVQRVKEKQSVIISSPSKAFDSELTGKVIWIANNVGKAEMVPLDPRAAMSDRVVHVKVALDNPQRVARLIGLQVQIRIITEESGEAGK